MIQKIIKVGNSAAITLPKEFLKEANIKIGDEIALETNAKLQMFFGKPKAQDQKNSLTPEFKDWLDNFIDEYQPILKELAHK